MLGHRATTTLLRTTLHARLPLRPSPFQCLITRFYASPGRPRKTVGEPSRPVKRAVKRAAKSTNGGEAEKQVKVKKATAATKAKKPAAKKAAAKKPTAAAKAKAAKAKAAARPRRRAVRKELTDEQKAAKAVRVAKAKTADLKRAALKPPPHGGISAYNTFVSEKMKGVDGRQIGNSPEQKEYMRERMGNMAMEWKSLNPAELEHYNHLSHTRTETALADYKRWVESHTPEQIQLANNARRKLRRGMGEKAKGSRKWPQIQDERAVKRPASSYVQFSVNRHASGDFKNIKLPERSKLIGQEWKALSESEKAKYKTLQVQDQHRYADEHTSVHGHTPPSYEGDQPPQQAAASA